jgi:predicted DNA-binding ArsR family transcriptional regulator
MFRLKYKKPSSGEIRVPNKRYHFFYISLTVHFYNSLLKDTNKMHFAFTFIMY